MRGMRRFTLLNGALGVLTVMMAVMLTVMMAVAGPSADAVESSSPETRAATVQVQGTLLVAQPDRPGSRPAYAVALADGDLVPVSGELEEARPLSHFTGRLTLPHSVVSALARRGTSVRPGLTLGATSVPGREALRLVDHRSLTLRVSGTPILTRAVTTKTTEAAGTTETTPTAHRQFVAAIDNKGALGQNDQALLAHVRRVGSYWKGEANGAISRIDVPGRVTRYRSKVSTKDCGLGDDFFDVLQEAAAKFPGIDLSGGSDQLVLFVPPGCSSGGMVGEGTIGSSFASGGALIVKAGTTINGTYAHETGHNYGFNHADALDSGSSMEYYGAYDVMGFALAGYNQLTALSTPFRVFQGITDPGEIRDVDLGGRSRAVRATVTIRPRSRDAGLRSIRVVDPDTGKAMYLDYRSGTGDDAGAYYTARDRYLTSGHGHIRYAPGVTLNVTHDGSGDDTLVVDASGGTSLGAGSSWTDASGRVSIHVGALTAAGAKVTVRLAPQNRQAPQNRLAP
jgi:hypothetical protein